MVWLDSLLGPFSLELKAWLVAQNFAYEKCYQVFHKRKEIKTTTFKILASKTLNNEICAKLRIFPTFHITSICTLPRYTYPEIFSPRRLYTQKLWPKTYFSWTAYTAHICALFKKLSMQSWSTRWADQNISWRHKLEMVGRIPFVLRWLWPNCALLNGTEHM